jgi:hypothetical protein
MKKIFVSAGLAAIGAGSLYAADTYAPDVTAMDASKIWGISGTLRGFYDDNYTTAHSEATGKRASWGFEFSPSLNFIIPLQQTEIGLRYTYGLYYYQDREHLGQTPIDQSHAADLWIDHAFTERLEGKVQDSLTVSQEPQLTATATSLPYRAEGNNINNLGSLTLHTEWTMLMSTDLGYQNNYTAYQNHGTTIANLPTQGPSLAGLLNEDGNMAWLNLNYEYEPDLTFLVGYQFGLNEYLGGEPIAIDPVDGNVYYSSDLDNVTHSIYVGGQYAFNESLTASLQVGAQIVDNDNLPSWDNQSVWNVTPYGNAAITYTYLPGSYVQLGVTQSENSSDISSPNPTTGALTLYEESTVVYGSVNQQITPFLLGSVIGRYQYSSWHSGAYAGGAQELYDLGLNLSYTINEHLSAEVGYNLDYLASGSGVSSYARNRGYIGITASY